MNNDFDGTLERTLERIRVLCHDRRRNLEGDFRRLRFGSYL